jgi:hypothetical protein
MRAVIDEKHKALMKKINDAEKEAYARHYKCCWRAPADHMCSTENQCTFKSEITPLLAAVLGDITGESPAEAAGAPQHSITVQNIGVTSQKYNAAVVKLLTQCGGMLYTYEKLCKRDSYNSRHDVTVAAFDKDKKTAASTLEDCKARAVTDIENKLADGHGAVRRDHRRETTSFGRGRDDERGWSDVEGVFGGLLNAISHRG